MFSDEYNMLKLYRPQSLNLHDAYCIRVIGSMVNQSYHIWHITPLPFQSSLFGMCFTCKTSVCKCFLFSLKCTKIVGGPDLRWGSLQRSPRSLSCDGLESRSDYTPWVQPTSPGPEFWINACTEYFPYYVIFQFNEITPVFEYSEVHVCFTCIAGSFEYAKRILGGLHQFEYLSCFS